MSRLMSIGAGNMASALLYPMRTKLEEFLVFTPSGTSANKLAEDMGEKAKAIPNLSDTPEGLDFLFLGFKPQGFHDASDEFLKKSSFNNWSKKPVVVSMLAGTPMEVLKEKYGTDRVARIMPNTPAKVGAGISLLLCGEGVSKEEQGTLQALLELAGPVYVCENEDQLDKITAVTGSGPAYVFEFARLMGQYLQEEADLSKEDAETLARALFKGSSLLMDNAEDDLETLREKVTSKKGVTLAALESFWDGGFQDLTLKSLKANYKRSLELRSEALKK